MKTTPWFKNGEKPKRVGAYKIQHRNPIGEHFYKYFDGERWGFFSKTLKKLELFSSLRASQGGFYWKGLTK